jgi:RNA polymerase sigma-70 factor (ECF subfamily)
MLQPDVQLTELRLVDSAASGDREARRELFERYRDAAYQVALRITGRTEDALDVVQDSFIRAFDGLRGFQRDAVFKTWLLRIVSNRALDFLRARKVRLAAPIGSGGDEADGALEPLADEPGPGRGLERQEMAARISAAVEKLPPDQRSVFALYASGDMTYGGIAEVLGIPIGTVMSRLFHARTRLKQALADLDPAARRET